MGAAEQPVQSFGRLPRTKPATERDGVAARVVEAARSAQNGRMPVAPRGMVVFAVLAGTARLATGISFLVVPEVAHRMWGGAVDSGPAAAPLLRSMGYRDALIGGLLLQAGLRRRPTAGWFLAFAGADATDIIGGLASLDRLTEQQRRRGLGGAAVGFTLGLIGAIAADRSYRRVGSTAEPA